MQWLSGIAIIHFYRTISHNHMSIIAYPSLTYRRRYKKKNQEPFDAISMSRLSTITQKMPGLSAKTWMQIIYMLSRALTGVVSMFVYHHHFRNTGQIVVPLGTHYCYGRVRFSKLAQDSCTLWELNLRQQQMSIESFIEESKHELCITYTRSNELKT